MLRIKTKTTCISNKIESDLKDIENIEKQLKIKYGILEKHLKIKNKE